MQKRTYFRRGQEKYSLQQGEGAEFQFFLRTYLMDDPQGKCRTIFIINLIQITVSALIVTVST